MEIKRVEEEIAAKLGSDFEPSTKMTRMMELIQQWRKETPDDKIIIYSQCMYKDHRHFLLINRPCTQCRD